MKEINKNVILVNGSVQLEMKEVESGNTIRSIIHFGAYTEKLDKHIFKGNKELRVREVNFDDLAYHFCSPYGDDKTYVHLILEEGGKKMKLNKELVDELIRLTKKYYRTGEVPALGEAENELEQECKATFDVITLIGDLAKFTQNSGKGTYEDIYKALEIFGVIVE